MDRIATYFAMGGYAGYVWPAFAVAALVMIGQLVLSLRGLRRREAAVAALEASRPRRKAPSATGGAGTGGPGKR
jgi:heme exporter protein D